ncbi:MAG: YmdB family metallophosphoesterase [Clostridia bacterium]|nr:YmdB family metallophosphoesterase [Clostridia bacterium]
MKILAIGDVVGEQALRYLATELPRQRRALGADLVIVNGENVCDVRGISPTAADALIEYGADILTSGNHVFDRRDIYDYLDRSKALLRPINYPAECPGEGARIVTSADGWRVLVINVSGCVFMDALANPFASVEHALDGMRGKYDLAVLDVHAEATSEKIALARYFDGRIAVIFGTHTHVATADEQVLPNGTGYITDLGMTGPVDGILGVCAEDVIFKSRTHLPRRFTVASGEIRAHGALFEVDPVTSKAKSVKRVVF